MEAILRHTLKLALLEHLQRVRPAAQQSQDPRHGSGSCQNATAAQQQTGSQPVQQKNAVTPKNSKEDVDRHR